MLLQFMTKLHPKDERTKYTHHSMHTILLIASILFLIIVAGMIIFVFLTRNEQKLLKNIQLTLESIPGIQK